jgi:uncharacterized RDD family membrane protein YckC
VVTPGDPLGPSPERPADPLVRERGYGSSPAPPGAFAPRERAPWPPPEHELAEWWRRVVATLVDGLIVGGITIALLAVLGVGLFGDGDASTGDVVVAALVGTILFAAIALLYAPLTMARTGGQTLGKVVARCRVVRAGGRRVDFWWAAWREVVVKGILLGIASSLTGGIAYLVDVLWPLWDGQNRALHDFVVDSRVVKA